MVPNRKIEQDLFNAMLDAIQYRFHEDNIPTNIYTLTFFLAKTIRERYNSWDTGFLMNLIYKGMTEEIKQTLSNPNYQFVNDESPKQQEVFKHKYDQYCKE